MVKQPIGYPKITEFSYSCEKRKKNIQLVTPFHSYISIISPISWKAHEQESKNLSWTKLQKKIVLDSIKNLPNKYSSFGNIPLKILLLKDQRVERDRIGGGYDSKTISLYISKSTNLSTKFKDLESQESILFRTKKHWLRSTLIHEWTHFYIEQNPKILIKWIGEMKWKQNTTKQWTCMTNDSFIKYANADKFPSEDIAVSASLFYTNPSVLSDNRKKFFLNF